MAYCFLFGIFIPFTNPCVLIIFIHLLLNSIFLTSSLSLLKKLSQIGLFSSLFNMDTPIIMSMSDMGIFACPIEFLKLGIESLCGFKKAYTCVITPKSEEKGLSRGWQKEFFNMD